ncbi:MAG: lamin tail domain-containing protein, partial [Pirellulaceae bacterium]|nr:lamin tail domain-containing protein [Pirellulaceae bacterium]
MAHDIFVPRAARPATGRRAARAAANPRAAHQRVPLQDWIEIYNPDAQPVDLTGWTLRDSGNTWTFPSVTLGPGEFRVVFASGNDLITPELHTNFRLSRDPGEYLGLLDNLGRVVHEYRPGYPRQEENVSYGLGQNIDETKLVSAGAETRYFVPTNASLATTWTQPSFNDASWAQGPTGLGFANLVPGFAVWNYKASIAVSDLAVAQSVISTPSYQTAVHTQTIGVVNFEDTGGGGHYAPDESFPGMPRGIDHDDFVVRAAGIIHVPTTNDWTFGVNSDDGFRLRISGVTFDAAYGQWGTTINGDTLEFSSPRGPDDSFGVINSLAAGDYRVELISYERGGGASTELFAAPGVNNSWNSDFRLIGDTAHGGLAVTSEPFDGSGSGSTFASLIRTDVKAAMQAANNASLYSRITFGVADPQSLQSLTLKMKYDDGYVAYLNGVEIARRNAPTSVAYNSRATAERPDSQAIMFENVNVSQHLHLLQPAGNVLAIQTLNVSPADGDLLVLPELSQIVYQGMGEHYFSIPTPGASNSPEYWYRVAETHFSVDRGFYTQPFSLIISTATPGATIRYSLNGATPTDADNTKSLTSITRSGSTATATLANHGYANGDWVLVRGATAREYNGVFVISGVTANTFDYTVSGVPATPATGTMTAQANCYTYTGPITIDRTTTVRAAAFKTAYAATDVDTQTYVFLDDVLVQPAVPPGLPATWNGTPADYQMDPDIVDDPAYRDTLKEALRSLPTMSIVTDQANLFDPATGIYANPLAEGWERPMSLEYFDPEGSGDEFQVNAGLRIYGGVGRYPEFKKHSLRVVFKDVYGPGKLDFPLFGDQGTDRFDTLILRSNFNDGWTWGGSQAQFIRDQFADQTLLAMMSTASHGEFVHLYVNGMYWGVYNPVERPDASFAASYLGGNREDWDAVNAGEPVGGSSMQPWYDLMNFNFEDGSTAAYQRVQGNFPNGTDDPAVESLLDVPNYIDYMLLNFFVCNADWPGHNWYVARPRGASSTGFKFFPWDTEMALGLAWIRDPAGDMTGVGGADSNDPAEPYYWLRKNTEFRMLFADRAHKHLFNDGALTTAAAVARYESLANAVAAAITAESARWGDVVSGVPFKPTDWQNERDWLLSTYLPQRNGSLIQQLRNGGLYPSTEAPTFQVNGTSQHGGTFQLGAALGITAPAGRIYYSVDGSDPRLPGGAIRPGALVYDGPITLIANTHVKSRTYVNGVWSAMNEATYYVDLAPSIRITEMMYNPAPPTAAEMAAGFANNDDFEFLEIKNIGTETLPLGGLRFSDGIAFTFPDAVSIAPGQYRVIVRNEPAFLFRYGTVNPSIIAGEYAGSLDNAGETIELDAPVGGDIHLFEYQDDWYDQTDGAGFSLTIRDPLGALTLWDASDGWRSSAAPGGTPGYDDALVVPGSVVINEVLAHQDASPEDMIELHNTTDQAIDVGGWFLSDAADDLTKYRIAADTWIAAHGYLVLTEDADFGAGSGDPGARVPFALSEYGDDVYLSSNASGVAGGYREHVDFGATPRGRSVGRHVKSTGATDFTLLETQTFGVGPLYSGALNSAPLVVSELMYHPAAATAAEIAAGYGTDDFEFLEIYNRSGTVQTLRNFYLGDGIGFTFGWYDADGSARESWTLEPGAAATWTAHSLQNGAYEVLVRYDLYDAMLRKRDLDDAAQYRITSASGSTLVSIDQDDDVFTYTDPDGWVSLGTYSFNGTGTVELTRGSAGPNDWTIADQVKFRKVNHEVIVDDPVCTSPWSSRGPVTLDAGTYLVLVSDYGAFDARYDVAANAIPVAGVYSGALSNNGDAVKLFQIGDADPLTSYVPYYRADYTNFKDHAPWPAEPDGTGSSLNRLDVNQYGNDPINWIAGGRRGTPGKANVAIDKSAPSAPTLLTSHVTANPDAITLQWAAAIDHESYVDYYVVYRDGKVLGTATTTSWRDEAVEPLRPYAYEVSAVNRDGYEGLRSTRAVVTVPGIINYSVPDASHIELVFTEALTPATATALGNYVFTGGELSGATLSANGLLVTLSTTQPLVVGNAYSVTIHNLATVSGNELRDGLGITFTYAPQGDGFILREYWTGIGGVLVTDLTNSPGYPDSPAGRAYETSFEGPVNWNDNYGTRMRGYVHPPTSGAYIFWISSDDYGELWLSTDEDPANKVQIASVPGWTDARQWTRYAAQQSAPIVLTVGRKYYIEALAKEGGGGDNIAVRWQLPGGNWEDPADPDAPLPGIRLSQWGPRPDTSAPTVPDNLCAVIVTDTRVDLSWAAATDPESSVHHYVVYRDGQEYARSTTPSYSDTGASSGVRHRYQVSATNPFDVESGRSATISVAPAGMVSAAALSATSVQIVFTEPMDRTRAEQAANYALSDGVTVTAATLRPDGFTVRLTTSTLALGTTYTVTVNDLCTASAVFLPADHQTTCFYGNGVLWEYWLNIGVGNAVGDLTSHPDYPHNPSGREYRTLFEAPANWADAYGGRMRGYLTPTTTGD